ncbi:MAG TPA: hypothetical protein VGP62_22160 [Bryobacteraceae bacterium]|jgi:hypothetical protein|nr:hypothetical protein [Bryobacteraceae bacterium]
MQQTVTKVEHYSAAIPNQMGEGARVLGALRDAGINLIALWAYPSGSGIAQLEMIAPRGAAFPKTAKKAGLQISAKQTAFFVNGEDYPGAVADTLSKLANAGINVGAVQAICAGKGRYGAVVFLPQASAKQAAKALGIS